MIDRSGPITLSAKVKDSLIKRIGSKEFKENEKIPSEEALAQEYNVSRITVRHALIELINEGYLFRVPGKGTFVSKENNKTDGNNLILLIVPNLRHSFYHKIVTTIETTLWKNSFHTILRVVNDDPVEEKLCLQWFEKIEAKALIIISGRYSSENAKILDEINKKVPMVVIDVAIQDVKCDIVVSDDKKGGFLITKHLIELGHKNILHLAGPQNDSSAQERYLGYKEALEKNNIELNSLLVRFTDWDMKNGYYETKKFFSNKSNSASAIFACNDEVAAGAYKALKELGIKVPFDVALTGYGNLEHSKYLEIPLTTVDQSEEALGKTAVNLIFEKISGKRKINNYKEVRIPVKIVVRDSCGISDRYSFLKNT